MVLLEFYLLNKNKVVHNYEAIMCDLFFYFYK